MGRACVANSFLNSGELSAADEPIRLCWPEGESDIMVMDARKVASYVVAHAGVGKLDVSPASPTLSATPSASSSAVPSSSVWVKRDGIRDAAPGAAAESPQRTPSWKTVVSATAVPTGVPSRVPAEQKHGILPPFCPGLVCSPSHHA
ncbi:hypothetical protein IFM62136_08598 [Aspergillus lentulus]|nr:hypothetical protein IFM62136_08598 [Aspergillus lentulus]